MKRPAGPQEDQSWQMKYLLYLVILPCGILFLGWVSGIVENKKVKEPVAGREVVSEIRATQTAEVAHANATGEALAHAAETSSATTDITAILDEDPIVVGPIEAVALQLHAVSPLARGLRYQESFKVVVAGKHSSIPKGSIVTLRCGDDPSQLLCVVIAVVTPVP